MNDCRTVRAWVVSVRQAPRAFGDALKSEEGQRDAQMHQTIGRLAFGHASFPVSLVLVSGVVMFIFLAHAAIPIGTGPAIDDVDVGVWMQVADFLSQ